jgi:hypothetical protein
VRRCFSWPLFVSVTLYCHMFWHILQVMCRTRVVGVWRGGESAIVCHVLPPQCEVEGRQGLVCAELWAQRIALYVRPAQHSLPHQCAWQIYCFCLHVVLYRFSSFA